MQGRLGDQGQECLMEDNVCGTLKLLLTEDRRRETEDRQLTTGEGLPVRRPLSSVLIPCQLILSTYSRI